jgi:hypothetical protein
LNGKPSVRKSVLEYIESKSSESLDKTKEDDEEGSDDDDLDSECNFFIYVLFML